MIDGSLAGRTRSSLQALVVRLGMMLMERVQVIIETCVDREQLEGIGSSWGCWDDDRRSIRRVV